MSAIRYFWIEFKVCLQKGTEMNLPELKKHLATEISQIEDEEFLLALKKMIVASRLAQKDTQSNPKETIAEDAIFEDSEEEVAEREIFNWLKEQ
ncbi:MAG: hypothetical protein ACJAWV_000570 [Flammeovirgaceae bacterium]